MFGYCVDNKIKAEDSQDHKEDWKGVMTKLG